MTGSSGVSSTPQLLVSITNVPEYWITRRSLSSGGHSADPSAGDDGWECDAFVFNELPSIQFSNSQSQAILRPSLRAQR
ncbi:MAG TPA: hypothetical protein VEN78_26690, partial [Bradyrhizobium sp.]|nr:hypothetical protein [Bradyrhizobium sp.]